MRGVMVTLGPTRRSGARRDRPPDRDTVRRPRLCNWSGDWPESGHTPCQTERGAEAASLLDEKPRNTPPHFV